MLLRLGHHEGVIDVCVIWLLLQVLLVGVDLLPLEVVHHLRVVGRSGDVLGIEPALFLLVIHHHLILLLLLLQQHLLLLIALLHLLLLTQVRLLLHLPLR